MGSRVDVRRLSDLRVRLGSDQATVRTPLRRVAVPLPTPLLVVRRLTAGPHTLHGAATRLPDAGRTGHGGDGDVPLPQASGLLLPEARRP